MTKTEKIANGFLENMNGHCVPYIVLCSNDCMLSLLGDFSWKSFTYQTMHNIKSSYSKEDQDKIISCMQQQHTHWDWGKKATILMNQDGYDFFYLVTKESDDNKMQCMCITYHPKKSHTSDDNIFYIEFLASAPWNNDTPLYSRRYKSVAKNMIAIVTDYLSTTKNIIPAFSLVALEQAKGFYEKIGMINYPEKDEARLFYYEISLANCSSLLQGCSYEKTF